MWNEHRETTRGRDCDITGLSYSRLEAAPALWPWPDGASEGTKRLYEDGVFATEDGRARFADPPYIEPAEARDARFAFALNTGRLRYFKHDYKLRIISTYLSSTNLSV